MFRQRSTKTAITCTLALATIGAQAFEMPERTAPVEETKQWIPSGAGKRLAQAADYIRAVQARNDFNVDGSGLTVAVLDTGLRTTHVDFQNKIPTQRNWTSDNGGNVNDASDGQGHGTNVAGIIVANGDHTGIAPGANVIPLKVLANSGSGSFADINAALQWVIDNRQTYNITTVNMSLGDSSNESNPTNHSLIDQLRAARVAVVVSAGNDFYSNNSQQGMGYPASEPSCISVGAVYDANIGEVRYRDGAIAYTTAAGRVTPFSQRIHPSVNTQSRTDIFSTGASITSSGINGDNGESSMHGTSQAAPTVAGVVLLMQQYYHRATNEMPTVDQLESWLRDGGVAINDGDDEDDNVTNTGLGFILTDAVGALQAAANEVNGTPQITQQPQDASVSAGQQATFSVTASGAAPLSYQWQRNGSDISGATSSSYTTPSLTSNDHGARYRCRVSNNQGSVNSREATLSVGSSPNRAPSITNGPFVSSNPAKQGQQLSFSVEASDPDGDALSYSWNFGDGSSASGRTPTHTFTRSGQFTVSVTVSDGSESATDGGTITVDPNATPTFDSTMSASPNPAFVGGSVSFSSSASDADGDALTYTWDFGDGSTGQGASVSKTYNSAGSYAVTVRVSDGYATATDSMTLEVSTAAPLNINRMIVKVNFRASGRDTCKVDCSIDLPAGSSVSGLEGTLNVGGMEINFRLDHRGRAKGSTGTIVMNTKKRKFTANLRRGTFSPFWEDEGLTNETVSGRSVQMPVSLTLDGSAFAGTMTMFYSAREGKVGKAR